MATTPSQLTGLTGLRGIAAWLVVLYHLREDLAQLLPALPMAVIERGYLAVDLFFLLSGFVIWLNYAHWFQQRGWGGYFGFLQKRWARIWPLHTFLLLAMVAMAAGLALLNVASFTDRPWAELPLHFLLMQNWGFLDDTRWNAPAWSISTEFAAYLLFPLLVLLARPDRWPVWAVLASVPVLSLALHLLFALNGGAALNFDVPHLGLGRCLLQFTLGAFLCILWQRVRHRGNLMLTLGPVLTVAMSALWVAGLAPETLIFPLLAAPLLLVIAHGEPSRWNWLGWRPIEWLGTISYSTYLIHFIGWTFFKQLVVRAEHASPAFIAIFLAVLLVASAISYYLVEQPGRRFFAALGHKTTESRRGARTGLAA